MKKTKDFLEKIIREAGALTLDYRRRFATLRVESKASDKDLVTEADQATEALLRKRILAEFPEHSIIGEEEGETGRHSCRWIIDPIDGTISYLHGQAQYSVSIALEVDGEVMLGAVFAPALDELFTAAKGEGSLLNGKAIGVSRTERLGDAVVSSGFPCIRAGLKKTNLPVFNALIPIIRDFRRGGSVALDLCSVACGRHDAHWEKHIEIYDVAAGLLIAEEAGGRVSDYAGSDEQLPREILVTNGKLHDEFMDVLRPFIPMVR